MQKGVFFRLFFGFGGFVFFSLCFCGFVLLKITKFSCIFRGVLSILFPQKACLKVFLFFQFCFFCFCLPFQKSIFIFSFCPSAPFNKRLFVGFLFFFFCLSFPFLRFAYLFDTNFPNIPFLKSNLLSFLAVSFFFCCVVLVYNVYVSVFLFFVVMLALFLVFLFCFVLCFCFCSSFLFCFQSLKKRLLSLQFWCFF